MGLTRLGNDWIPLIERVAGDVGHAELVAGEVALSIAEWLDLTVEWSKKIDLTAARSSEELVELFLTDALVVAAAAHDRGEDDARWVDVGSGAGAPGIPLALFGVRVETLVEPRGKRVAFLRSVVGRLEIHGVEILRGRSDAITKSEYDVAISRATLPPEEWLAEGARIATRAVWVLLARGEPPELTGWAPSYDRRYELPNSRAERRAVCYLRSE